MLKFLFLRKLLAKRKNKRLRRRVAKLVLAPTAILFAVLFLFFCSDDFWMYAQLQLFNTDDIGAEDANSYGSSQGDDSSTNNGGGNGTIGNKGVQMMLANQMAAGYTKDWLEIVRDHCNWKFMPGEAGLPVYDYTPMYPSVVLAIGTTLAETGIGSDYIPRTALDPAKYGSHNGQYNLKTVNSELIRQWGEEELYIMCGIDMSYSITQGQRPDTGKTYRSQFQINKNYASVYPTYTTGTGSLWPSTMNGYGISSTKVRGKSETDMAYFPDQVAMMIQCGWSSAGNYIDLSNTTANNVTTVTYSAYNGGWGIIRNTWALGDTPTSSKRIDSFNSVSRKTLSTEVVNDMSSLIEIASDYITKFKISESEFNYRNHSDYGGLSALMLLTKGNGFFASSKCLNDFKQSYKDAGFKRGALIGYRAGTGNPDATIEDLDTFVNNLRVEAIDSEYGTIYSGKTSYNEYVICYYDDTFTLKYQKGGKSLKAIHAINEESIRGCYITRIGGPYVYWKMLLNAGVECTLAEAVEDLSGSFIQEAIDTEAPVGAFTVNNSTAAHAAVSYAYATTAEGKNNNGTPLYQALHRAILPGDPYFMSCDRGVCVAVRWSGTDDSYPPGACRNQIPYMVLSTKWEELDWGGDIKNLLPGDVLIRYSGGVSHTLMYTGNAIIRAKFPDADEGLVQVSASLNQRSPGCGVWYTDSKVGYQTYRAFRNIVKEANSKYKNLKVEY